MLGALPNKASPLSISGSDRSPARLPSVFPVLIYNGGRRWTAKTKTEEIIEPSIPPEFIPHFSYHPIIVNRMDRDVLRQIHNALSAVFLLENANDREIEVIVHDVVDILEHETIGLDAIRRVVAWMMDFFGDERPAEDVEKQIETITEVQPMLAETVKKYGERLKREFADEVREQVRAEVRGEVRAEVKDEVRAEIEDKVRAEVTARMENQVRAEVTTRIEDQVRAEIAQETRLENARQMLKSGIDAALIADAIGLSPEEVQALEATPE